jgi:predicted nucleotidyltransferase
MRTSAPALLPLFRSELQARLLTLLFLDADRGYATSDLRDKTGASPASLHRELARLEAAGLAEVEHVGRTKIHRAAAGSPLFDPLRTLIERTLGIEVALRARLEPIAGIELAAIYGSLAEGRVGPGSGIDLLVVGDADLGEVYDAVADVERLAGREIQVRGYASSEFARLLRERSGFITTVLSRPLTPLVGSIPGRRA